MRKLSFSSPETQQEILLRATLQQHAPDVVDLDHAWGTISQRIVGPNKGIQQREHFWPLRVHDLGGSRWRKATITVAIAVLAFLLMGAGFASGFFWHIQDPVLRKIADQQLYTRIGQTQHVGEITVTVNWAYADSDRTLIQYDVQLPPDVAKHYNSVSVLNFSLTAQPGKDSDLGGFIECEAFPQNGSPMQCLMEQGPFDPGSNVKRVTFTMNLLRFVLIPPPPAHDKQVTGDWHFQFTIPFSHKHLGPAGPFPQPTRSSSSRGPQRFSP